MRDPPALPFYQPPSVKERLEHEAAKPYSARLRTCQTGADDGLFCPYHRRQADVLDCLKARQAQEGTNQMRERV